jgi:hypothetical protein
MTWLECVRRVHGRADTNLSFGPSGDLCTRTYVYAKPHALPRVGARLGAVRWRVSSRNSGRDAHAPDEPLSLELVVPGTRGMSRLSSLRVSSRSPPPPERLGRGGGAGRRGLSPRRASRHLNAMVEGSFGPDPRSYPCLTTSLRMASLSFLAQAANSFM